VCRANTCGFPVSSSNVLEVTGANGPEKLFREFDHPFEIWVSYAGLGKRLDVAHRFDKFPCPDYRYGVSLGYFRFVNSVEISEIRSKFPSEATLLM